MFRKVPTVLAIKEWKGCKIFKKKQTAGGTSKTYEVN